MGSPTKDEAQFSDLGKIVKRFLPGQLQQAELAAEEAALWTKLGVSSIFKHRVFAMG